MLIGWKNSWKWVLVSGGLCAFVGLRYLFVDRLELNGLSGGSFWGLVYAGIGSFMMLFAFFLAAKKHLKVPTLRGWKSMRVMRIGSSYWWTRGHIWFGFFSYVIILCHGGWRFGGTGSLTWWLMWLFTIVWGTGLVGIFIQQYLPTLMLDKVPQETIYEQIDHVSGKNLEEAENRVRSVTEGKTEAAYDEENVPAGSVATLPAMDTAKMLRDFYAADVKPFLSGAVGRKSEIGTKVKATLVFDQMRSKLPPEYHEVLGDLEDLADERRQFILQTQIHRIMHGWLWLHVPISYALMILAVLHAVNALRYAT